MEKKEILERILYIKAVISDISVRCEQYEYGVMKYKNEYKEFNKKFNIASSKVYVEDLKSIDDYIEETRKSINVRTNNLKQLNNIKSDILNKNIKYGYLEEKQDEINKLLIEKVDSNIASCENSIEKQKEYLEKAIALRDTGLDNQKKSLESLNELKSKTDQYYNGIQKNLKITKQKIELMYKSLCEDSKDFLNASDFDKLEYIYYYIETGRSDSIKDALNLVDTQLRHEELVGVLNDAVKTICRAIQYSTNEIKNSINDAKYSICNHLDVGFTNLNSQLNSLNNEMESLGISLSSIIKQNDEIIDASRLTNSLIERQNDSCEKMLQDYEYVNRMSGVIL